MSSVAPRRHPAHITAFGSLAVAALWTVATAAPVRAQTTAAPVKVAAVQRREIAAGQTFVGTIHPVRRGVVGSAVAGRVVKFLHNEGDYVDEGEVLAQILTGTIEIELAAAKAELLVRQEVLAESNKSFPAEQEQAEARLSAARAKRDHAQSMFRRAAALRERKSTSDEAYDAAQAAALEAEAEYLLAQAARRLVFDGAREQKIKELEARVLAQQEAVNLIEDRLSKFTIKAYFSGYVTAEFTEVGHWVKDGDAIVEIAEMDQVDARVNVPEDQIDQIEVGDDVRVDVHATRQKQFLGRIEAIVPQADLKTRTFPVLVRLKNPARADHPSRAGQDAARKVTAGHVLKSGMLARVLLPVGNQKDALLVPKDAVVLGGKEPLVYVVETGGDPAEGSARPVAVELGVASGGNVQVRALLDAELREGSLVVVEGNERLRSGQRVSFEAVAAPKR
jgi:RND family efflux transporter MFP subunit